MYDFQVYINRRGLVIGLFIPMDRASEYADRLEIDLYDFIIRDESVVAVRECFCNNQHHKNHQQLTK